MGPYSVSAGTVSSAKGPAASTLRGLVFSSFKNMQLSIQHDLARAAKDIRALGKQGALAQKLALLRTGYDVREAEYEEMRSVFDRPTRYTLNSIYVDTKTRGGSEVLIGVKDDAISTSLTRTAATRYLSAEIDGGSRSVKRFEKRLQLDGAMQKGWYVVPGKFARLDAFGNLSRGQITQLLSQLTVTKTSGYTAGITPRSRKAAIKRAGGSFVALPNGRGKLLPGIYQVRDTAFGHTTPKPIVIFVRQVHYRRRLDYFGVAKQAADIFYEANLNDALREYDKAVLQ